MSLVGKDKLEALEELKQMNSQELIEFREEHDELKTRWREAEIGLDQKRSLLNTVLLEKDELSKRNSEHKDIMMEKERDMADLRATIAALNGTSEGRDSALEKRVMQLQNKVEDYREKLTKSRGYIKKQNQTIKELNEKVESGAGLDEKAREEVVAEQKVGYILIPLHITFGYACYLGGLTHGGVAIEEEAGGVGPTPERKQVDDLGVV